MLSLYLRKSVTRALELTEGDFNLLTEVVDISRGDLVVDPVDGEIMICTEGEVRLSAQTSSGDRSRLFMCSDGSLVHLLQEKWEDLPEVVRHSNIARHWQMALRGGESDEG